MSKSASAIFRKCLSISWRFLSFSHERMACSAHLLFWLKKRVMAAMRGLRSAASFLVHAPERSSDGVIFSKR